MVSTLIELLETKKIFKIEFDNEIIFQQFESFGGDLMTEVSNGGETAFMQPSDEVIYFTEVENELKTVIEKVFEN